MTTPPMLALLRVLGLLAFPALGADSREFPHWPGWTRTRDPHSTAEMPLPGSAGEIVQIYEGTSQIQRVIIARELFDRG